MRGALDQIGEAHLERQHGFDKLLSALFPGIGLRVLKKPYLWIGTVFSFRFPVSKFRFPVSGGNVFPASAFQFPVSAFQFPVSGGNSFPVSGFRFPDSGFRRK